MIQYVIVFCFHLVQLPNGFQYFSCYLTLSLEKKQTLTSPWERQRTYFQAFPVARTCDLDSTDEMHPLYFDRGDGRCMCCICGYGGGNNEGLLKISFLAQKWQRNKLAISIQWQQRQFCHQTCIMESRVLVIFLFLFNLFFLG